MPKLSTFDIRILSATYTREEEGAVVELYGVTREGEGLVALYKGFLPYYVVCEASSEYIDHIERDPEVVSTTPLDLWLEGKERTCHKITIHNPWDVPRYRALATRECRRVLAADIPFGHRFMYDNKIEACTTVRGKLLKRGETRKEYSTKHVLEASGFEPCEPFNPPLSIFSFDIENSIQDQHLYTICWVFEGDEGREEGCICGEDNKDDKKAEKKILEEFVETVHHLDPDIITG
ncbi:MAG: DNA polymerase II, partial [Thermoplasmata archaeon]|nr:DNA polymerase II [Thermoplasmata archaeon]